MYKTPLRCKKAARRLATMLRADGEAIAAQLAPRMEQVLEEGESLPDVAHLMDVLGRMVVHESETLDSADGARCHEGAQARWLQRQLRDTVGPQLRHEVKAVRRQMVSLYGAAETRQVLEHSGRTPRDREGLEDLALRMLRRIPLLQPATMAGQKVHPVGLVASLRPVLVEFSRALDELGERLETREDEVETKELALRAFNRTYRRVFTLSTMMYRLAGLDRLAKYLKYRGGRPPRRSQPGSSGAA